jgi:hypothetical protein
MGLMFFFLGCVCSSIAVAMQCLMQYCMLYAEVRGTCLVLTVPIARQLAALLHHTAILLLCIK